MVRIKETKMKEIQHIAIGMLHVDPMPVGSFGDLFVSHPFFTTSALFSANNGQMFNLFEDENSFYEYKKEMEQIIKSRPDVFSLAMFITTPYKLTFFKYIRDYLSEKDFGELLSELYVQMEVICDETNVTRRELLGWFKKAKKEYLMDEDELRFLENLDEEVTIYRGVRDPKYKNGFSWTTNYNTAKWFAERYQMGTPIILKGKVQKDAILCYLNARNEHEIVVNPKKVNYIVLDS